MNGTGGHDDVDQIILDGLRTLRGRMLPAARRQEVLEAMPHEAGLSGAPLHPARPWRWWVATACAAAAVLLLLLLIGGPRPGTPNPASSLTVGSTGQVLLNPNFEDLYMESTTTGWAFVKSAQGCRIARSTNQGRTWHDITPRGVGRSLAFQPTGPESALLASFVPGRSASVYVTTDGGATWTRGTPFPIREDPGTTFRPTTLMNGGGAPCATASFARVGRHIWLDVGTVPLVSTSVVSAELFASDDSGKTFRLIARTGSSDGTGALPGFGALAFLNPRDGATSVVYESGGVGLPILFRTSDGGRTWSPAVSQVTFGGQLGTTPPVFTGQRGMVFNDLTDPQLSSFFPLVTVDGGASWRSPAEVDPFQVFDNPSSPSSDLSLGIATGTDIIIGTTAVVIDQEGYVASTTDGGATWTVAAHGTATSRSLAGLFFYAPISFATPRVGWAVGIPKTNPHSNGALYLTTDGGASWQRVAN